MQHDLGAAGRPVHGFQPVLAGPVGFPADALGGRQAGPAGRQRHPVGHHERGVEAHAELADERRVLTLVAGEGLEEVPGAGLGDGADVLDDLGAAHADAVVGDGDRARGRVEGDLDLQRALVLVKLGPGEDLEAQPVDGVGGVRDQLAEEDLLVAVERVDHQVEDLDDFSLETEALPVRLHAHQMPAHLVGSRSAASRTASPDGLPNAPSA